LMDFGAGSRASVPDDPAGRAGTPMYTPPEIFAGEKPSPRSDLFSLGVLLFGLLTGRFPVEADSLKEVIAAHVEGRRARLLHLRPEVPAGLARAVERAMAPTPDDRFRTAREMGDALRRWAPAPADATPAAETAAVPAPAAALRSPRILPWTIALAVLAVIVVMLVRTPAPTALIAEAELLRGTDPAEQLISGDVVQAGDLLHLRLDVAHESWIYVLNRDDRGSLSLLFPLPGYVLQNPVSPGGAVAIPGAPAGSRTNMAWEMGGGGGTERFLVVAARKPLEDFEAELRRLPLPGEGATARALDESAAAGLYRGVADMAQLPEPAAPDGGAGRALFDLARSLDASGDGDVWVREIALRSP
ncbi:MAG TPA: DUF4384 domain-containing protein, partial [bacterium]|nr:DUF4384 domain-containing protein [bacterium]